MSRKIASKLLPVRAAEYYYLRDRQLDPDLDYNNIQIHLPTYNEEGFIEDTLISLKEQKLVDNGDVSLIVLDSKSDDGTENIARQHADRVLNVGKGKLTARNEGIEKLNPDLVIAADAGDHYPHGWVAEIIKPFQSESTVASYGQAFSKDPVWKRRRALTSKVMEPIMLPGNVSAIDVQAFNQVGKFNEDIDQLSRRQMIVEEQMRLRNDLESIGSVEFNPHAAILKSQRHRLFTLENNDSYILERFQGKRF